jgi:hypothetical protein
VFFFLVGVIAPVVQWTFQKKFKMEFLKYLNFPLIFTGTGNLPPATPLNYVPWVLVCFVFNYVIRRRHFGWWSKYNCESEKKKTFVLVGYSWDADAPFSCVA